MRRRLHLDRPVPDRLQRTGEPASRARPPSMSGRRAPRFRSRAPVMRERGLACPSSLPGLLDRPARPADQPKIGCASGAVRKSPERPGPPSGAAVVAVPRLIQGAGHEPCEGDRAVALDLTTDRRHQRRVLADGLGVGQGLDPVSRLHRWRHRPRPPRHARRPPPRARRAPGPTSPCPPSRIGIGAVSRGRRERRRATDP